MKFGCLLAVTLVACANAAPQAAAAAAACSLPGAPCVDENGMASRCSVSGSVCEPASAPCSAIEGPTTTPCEIGICAPVEGMKMGLCLEPEVYRTAYSYDSCMDKNDGDRCRYITIDKDDKGKQATYQAKGKCLNGLCLEQVYSDCYKKKVGTECTYNFFKAGKSVEYQGQCVMLEPDNFMTCNGVEISRTDALAWASALKSSAAAPSAKNTTTAVPSKGQNATAPAPSDKNQTTPLPAVTAPKNVADPAPTATPKSSATTRSTAVLTLALLIISMAH